MVSVDAVVSGGGSDYDGEVSVYDHRTVKSGTRTQMTPLSHEIIYTS